MSEGTFTDIGTQSTSGPAKHRLVTRVLGAAAVVGLVGIALAPAALADSTSTTDNYPTPPPTASTTSSSTVAVAPTVVTAPPAQVQGTQATNTSSGTLPFTGGDVAGLAIIGGGIALVGGVMVHQARRNRATA